MIKVYSGPHVKFAALLMVDQLRKLGRAAAWVPDVDPKSTDLHIIYQAVRLEKMPRDYILCQTEPRGSHWFTTGYQDVIAHARAVWDYSQKNTLSYWCDPKMKISIVRPGVRKWPIMKEFPIEKNIDYLFYGWIEGSPHREKVLNELSRRINLTIITDKLEYDIWPILAHTKVVINIPHKPGNPLEGYRVCEALSHGCDVISESFDPFYLGHVKFLDSDCGMMNLPFHAEQPRDKRNLHGLDNLEEIKQGLKIAGL